MKHNWPSDDAKEDEAFNVEQELTQAIKEITHLEEHLRIKTFEVAVAPLAALDFRHEVLNHKHLVCLDWLIGLCTGAWVKCYFMSYKTGFFLYCALILFRKISQKLTALSFFTILIVLRHHHITLAICLSSIWSRNFALGEALHKCVEVISHSSAFCVKFPLDRKARHF